MTCPRCHGERDIAIVKDGNVSETYPCPECCPAERSRPETDGSAPSIAEVANVIHEARFGPDYPDTLRTPFDQEPSTGRVYCIRLARAVLGRFALRHKDDPTVSPQERSIGDSNA